MRIHLHIDKLHVGMFVEADVDTATVDGQTRHYLVLRDATFKSESGKKLRLTKRKQAQITHADGMLITSSKQIQILRDIDVLEAVVNTDKSDVVPDLPEVRNEHEKAGKTPTFVDVEGAAKSADQAPIEAGTTIRRRNFGPKSTGWMKVEISEERDKATLQVLSFGGDPLLGASHVFSALQELYGITNGLDNDLVERLASQATASPSRVIRGEFHVAVAPFPEGDDSGHIEYTCFDGKSIPGERSGGDLPELFQGESLHRLLDSKINVHLATPGEELARFVPPEGYQPPLDIFGQPLRNTGPGALLKPGPNVRLRQHAYLSETLGYVSIRDHELAVVIPIWISADRMEAHFVYFDHTESGETLTAESIGAALKTLQIKHGVRDSAVDELVASPPSGKDAASVLLAEGSQVKPSSPPRLETIFDSDWRKGPPARTATKALDAPTGVAMVEADQLLAEVRPSRDGEPGTDLLGKLIPPSAEGHEVLSAGVNVRCEWSDDIGRFYSAIEGLAKLHKNSIRVKPVAHIAGNVDENIVFADAEKDVYVTGSVRPGVVVRAAGSIAIDGMVESGAQVHSNEDVTVTKGVVGRQSQVVAMGDVATKFVQNGSIVARGDVNVTSHVVNARIRAGGKFTAESDGTERGGSVVGGQVFAASGVEVASVESTRSDVTRLGIAEDPKITAQIKKVQQALDFCTTNIQRIFRTLGTSEIDVVELKKSIENSPPHKREPLMLLLNQLKGLAQTREKSLKMKSDLEAQQGRLLEGSEIRVAGRIHPGVEISFGNESVTTKDELKCAVFSHEASGIACRQEDPRSRAGSA